MKRLLLVAPVLLLTACGAGTGEVIDTDADSSAAMSESGWTDDSNDVMMQDSDDSADTTGPSADGAATASADTSVAAEDPMAGARVVEMTVDDWSFNPASLTAKTGEKLVVRLKGVQGIHSFAIAELGINMRIEAGQTVDVVIPTDKAGTYAFRCRIPCGPGHKDMVGSLVIS